MREKYIPQQIEKKWQKIWEDNKAFETHYDPNKKKYYVRIRTYKVVSGKKYYSKWSSKKSVKIR